LKIAPGSILGLMAAAEVSLRAKLAPPYFIRLREPRRIPESGGSTRDWLFASPHAQGRTPYWPDILLSRVIRPAAVRAGIQKHIDWHTFRPYAEFRNMLNDRAMAKPQRDVDWPHTGEV
jgi:hypothetical protein